MPWELEELTKKQKAVLYGLIEIRLENDKNMRAKQK